MRTIKVAKECGESLRIEEYAELIAMHNAIKESIRTGKPVRVKSARRSLVIDAAMEKE